MKPKKIDGVIETVRYDSKGMISLIRVHERRGPTYSDRILLSREQLIQKLKTGKKFFVGRRIQLLGSTFDLGSPVFLSIQSGHEVVVSQASHEGHDELSDAPLF